MSEPSYVSLFNREIYALFGDALRISVRDPAAMQVFIQMSRAQRGAARRRAEFESQGLHVPPLLIISVTGRCNLACAGCYAHAGRLENEADLTSKQLLSIIQQGSDLGVGIMLLAGGEPMTRADDLLAIAQAVPNVVFPVFTNGTLVDDVLVTRLQAQRNLVPIVSVEGRAAETDARRGPGVADQVEATMVRLHRARLFFGASITVTRANEAIVLDERYIHELMAHGCRIFVFVEYVPVHEDTEVLTLTQTQHRALAQAMVQFHDHFPGLFVAFPGDESAYGGCLAAGRGFVHISPAGRVEACPFAPYADRDVRSMNLREALKSPLLAAIREAHGRLTETTGGCALWTQREWVHSLLAGADENGPGKTA
ncbi:MAG: radical SAM/SPASM domain-containing protein [Candidatus Cryosericum sp.]